MRVILILATLSFLACKKKTVTPAADVTPVTPACQTGAVKFSGLYVYHLGNHDTIQIIFTSNNCPKANSNTYVVKGLGKALQPVLKPGSAFAIKDYTVISDEVNGYVTGQDSNNQFSFNSFRQIPGTSTNVFDIVCGQIVDASGNYFTQVK